MITSAEFVKSSVELDKCPPAIYPEVAFIGRSNVGKSSLINRLTNKKGLAKTSGKPDLMRLGTVETGLAALRRPGPLHVTIERLPD